MTLDLANDFFFLDTTPKAEQQKKKVDKLGFIKIKNLCIKGYYQKSEKPTHRMRENICKSYA